MKHIDHKFVSIVGDPIDDSYINLFPNDYCIISGKSVRKLCNTINLHTNLIKEQFIILNRHSPCLTEDEYIIKSIIE